MERTLIVHGNKCLIELTEFLAFKLLVELVLNSRDHKTVQAIRDNRIKTLKWLKISLDNFEERHVCIYRQLLYRLHECLNLNNYISLYVGFSYLGLHLLFELRSSFDC